MLIYSCIQAGTYTHTHTHTLTALIFYEHRYQREMAANVHQVRYLLIQLHTHCTYHTTNPNYIQCKLYRGAPYDRVHYTSTLVHYSYCVHLTCLGRMKTEQGELGTQKNVLTRQNYLALKAGLLTPPSGHMRKIVF